MLDHNPYAPPRAPVADAAGPLRPPWRRARYAYLGGVALAGYSVYMFWSPAYAARWHFLPGILALCVAMTYSRVRAMWQRASTRTPVWSQALTAGIYLGALYGCWIGDYVVLTFFLVPVFTFFCALAVSTCVFEAANRTCVYIFDRRFEFESRETAA